MINLVVKLQYIVQEDLVDNRNFNLTLDRYFIWFDLNRPAMLLPEREGFNELDYCKVETINGTAVCLPEGVCEFQENSEGRNVCMAKRV